MAPRRADKDGIRIRRHFHLTLDTALAKQLQQWMAIEQVPPDQEPEVVRQLLRMQFATSLDEGYRASIRAQTYYETKTWVVRRMVAALREIGDLLEASVPSTMHAQVAGTDGR